MDDPIHTSAIQALAVEARLPVDRVSDVYGAELERLMVDARIKDFLPVLLSRRVRQILREQLTNRKAEVTAA